MKFNNKTLRDAVAEWLKDESKAKKKYGHISDWDTSQVTNMESLFDDASSFDEPIGNWDVSNVKDMSRMFNYARSFNQSLNNWDVSNVKNMNCMFYKAGSFNQPLNNWDVSNVERMSYMFNDAGSFNQPLNNWDVSNVKDMSRMFYNAGSFNQPLNNWDVSNVEKMSEMFSGAKSFKQDIISNSNIKFDEHIKSLKKYLNPNVELNTVINLKFEATKEFVEELKNINSKHARIFIYTENRSIKEITESRGTWNDNKYVIKAISWLKHPELTWDYDLKELIQILSKFDITALNSSNFHNFDVTAHDGSEYSIGEIEWDKPLTSQQQKDLENEGGKFQLFEDGFHHIEYGFEDGSVKAIQVVTIEKIYTLKNYE